MSWLRDERTGMYWQMRDPPRLSAENMARLADPIANVRAAVLYVSERYGKPLAWRPWAPSKPELHIMGNDEIDRLEGGDGDGRTAADDDVGRGDVEGGVGGPAGRAD